MSSFGVFEASIHSEAEQKLADREQTDKLNSAILAVRQQFGSFLFQADGLDDFDNRVALVKDDMRKAVEAAGMFPRTGVMRRVVNAQKVVFKKILADIMDGAGGAPMGGGAGGGFGEADTAPINVAGGGDSGGSMAPAGFEPVQGYQGPNSSWAPPGFTSSHHLADSVSGWTDDKLLGFYNEKTGQITLSDSDKGTLASVSAELDKRGLMKARNFSADVLVPEGDFDRYLNRVDEGAPHKVEEHNFIDGPGENFTSESPESNFTAYRQTGSAEDYFGFQDPGSLPASALGDGPDGAYSYDPDTHKPAPSDKKTPKRAPGDEGPGGFPQSSRRRADLGGPGPAPVGLSGTDTSGGSGEPPAPMGGFSPGNEPSMFGSGAGGVNNDPSAVGATIGSGAMPTASRSDRDYLAAIIYAGEFAGEAGNAADSSAGGGVGSATDPASGVIPSNLVGPSISGGVDNSGSMFGGGENPVPSPMGGFTGSLSDRQYLAAIIQADLGGSGDTSGGVGSPQADSAFGGGISGPDVNGLASTGPAIPQGDAIAQSHFFGPSEPASQFGQSAGGGMGSPAGPTSGGSSLTGSRSDRQYLAEIMKLDDGHESTDPVNSWQSPKGYPGQSNNDVTNLSGGFPKDPKSTDVSTKGVDYTKGLSKPKSAPNFDKSTPEAVDIPQWGASEARGGKPQGLDGGGSISEFGSGDRGNKMQKLQHRRTGAFWVQLADGDQRIAGPFESPEQAQAEIDAKSIMPGSYQVVQDDRPSENGFGSSQDYYNHVNQDSMKNVAPGADTDAYKQHNKNYQGSHHLADKDHLQNANQSLNDLVQELATDFQESIGPLQQALQAIQYAQQVSQQSSPMNVLQPGGIQVLPNQSPGGQPALGTPGFASQQGPPQQPPQQPQGQPQDPAAGTAGQPPAPMAAPQQPVARRRRAMDPNKMNSPARPYDPKATSPVEDWDPSWARKSQPRGEGEWNSQEHPNPRANEASRRWAEAPAPGDYWGGASGYEPPEVDQAFAQSHDNKYGPPPPAQGDYWGGASGYQPPEVDQAFEQSRQNKEGPRPPAQGDYWGGASGANPPEVDQAFDQSRQNKSGGRRYAGFQPGDQVDVASPPNTTDMDGNPFTSSGVIHAGPMPLNTGQPGYLVLGPPDSNGGFNNHSYKAEGDLSPAAQPSPEMDQHFQNFMNWAYPGGKPSKEGRNRGKGSRHFRSGDLVNQVLSFIAPAYQTGTAGDAFANWVGSYGSNLSPDQVSRLAAAVFEEVQQGIQHAGPYDKMAQLKGFMPFLARRQKQAMDLHQLWEALGGDTGQQLGEEDMKRWLAEHPGGGGAGAFAASRHRGDVDDAVQRALQRQQTGTPVDTSQFADPAKMWNHFTELGLGHDSDPAYRAKQGHRRTAWSGWGPAQFQAHRKVAGWEWNHRLNGYTTGNRREFLCDCGHELPVPGYTNCRCGKVWNAYAIGHVGDMKTGTADKYICREIPVRDGMIVASRQAWHPHLPKVDPDWDTPSDHPAIHRQPPPWDDSDKGDNENELPDHYSAYTGYDDDVDGSFGQSAPPKAPAAPATLKAPTAPAMPKLPSVPSTPKIPGVSAPSSYSQNAWQNRGMDDDQLGGATFTHHSAAGPACTYCGQEVQGPDTFGNYIDKLRQIRCPDGQDHDVQRGMSSPEGDFHRNSTIHDLTSPGECTDGEDDGRPGFKDQPDDWARRDDRGQWYRGDGHYAATYNGAPDEDQAWYDQHYPSTRQHGPECPGCQFPGHAHPAGFLDEDDHAESGG